MNHSFKGCLGWGLAKMTVQHLLWCCTVWRFSDGGSQKMMYDDVTVILTEQFSKLV